MGFIIGDTDLRNTGFLFFETRYLYLDRSVLTS